jgi:beta-lactam-binding protein with PASTA domain/tRNA A-37 threonylcarbamoyl transferase component Bud32
VDATLSDPLVDRLLDGRYAIEARLARGGMASVYLATDIRLERRVAVKVMHAALAEDPDFVARFNREARAAARLSHPAAVSVYDQGSDDGHVFLVMEYVGGATLREVLRERGKLTPAEAVAVMDYVLAALGAAHAAGLVHRDVKPENVLITPDGRVKVADFGLARAIAGTTLTGDDGMLLGTASYVSPEQVRDGAADARSDVYSAGVLFFELLTGTVPFTADTPLSVAYRHLSDDVPPPSSKASGIPAELDTIVRTATGREPSTRYADGGAMHAALSQARDALGLHGVVPAPPGDNTINLARARAPMPATVITSAGDGQNTMALPAAAVDDDGREPRRWPFVLAAVLILTAVAGVGGWWLAVGRYTHAPSVLRLTYTQAAAKLDDAGLHAQRGSEVFSESVAPGLVVSQDPGGGDRVHRGATITLHLSRGPSSVEVPDVSGKKVHAATVALRKVNLNVSGQNEAYSTIVPSGHVIRTDPPAGQTIDVSRGVTLIVSKGPRPVDVPDVTGKTYDEAASLLSAVHLRAQRRDVFSDTVPAGKVVDTQPAAGTTAHVGQTVTVDVSKGPRLIPVPDVTGKPIQEAIKKINEAGFRAEPRQIFPGGPGKVVRETPSGMQPPGTTIELDYY